LSAIFSAAVCILPSRVRVNPRYLKWLTSSRGVPSYVKVGIAEWSIFAEEDHDFCFVNVELEPLETEYRKAPPPRKGKESQWGSGGLQAWPETGSWWELIIVLERSRLVYMDKFSSKHHKVHMELGGKPLNSLRIKTQFLERLQSVSVVDGAAHT